MKVVTLVGSIRKDSYNQLLANYIQSRYKETMDIEMLNIVNLPFFNQDEENNPPINVKEFKQKITEADGVLVVTPEYNHSVPGMLKNALDWTSRVDQVLKGKPVLLVGSSTGMLGTVRCQIHLRQIFDSPGLSARVLPGNEVFIGMVQEKMDKEGNLIDQSTVTFLDSVVDNFTKFVNEITS